MKENLWVERYRPQTIDDCILPKKIKSIFSGYVKAGEMPNLLLTGTSGTGKTTLARALIRELGAEMLFIDASSDTGKRMVEESIVPFASTISIVNSKIPKVILCDEADGLTLPAQKSLRPNIEMYSKSARFIFTGNYREHFIDAIKSRCSSFNFNAVNNHKVEMMTALFNRAVMILKENSVEYDKKALAAFIGKNFPDFRKILNEMQSYSAGGGKIDEGILTFSSEEIASSLYPLILSKEFNKCRKWISESTDSPEDIYSALYSRMDQYVQPNKQPACIVCLADYQHKSAFVADQNLNLMACVVEMMGNI